MIIIACFDSVTSSCSEKPSLFPAKHQPVQNTSGLSYQCGTAASSGVTGNIAATLGYTFLIGSCLAFVYRVMDARGKFGELERSVRFARGDTREQLLASCVALSHCLFS